MGKNVYSRHQELSKDFNDYWQRVLGTNMDLFSQLQIDDFVGLKKAISNINNIVTLLVTDRFITFLEENKIVCTKQAEQMRKSADETHANTNGFDVEFDGDVKIVAEVKCNIPVGVDSYGAAQEESIMEDILHLWKSKKKSNLTESGIRDYYKFMVLLNSENVPKAACKLIQKMSKYPEYEGIDVKEYKSSEKLTTQTVYVVYIN